MRLNQKPIDSNVTVTDDEEKVQRPLFQVLSASGVSESREEIEPSPESSSAMRPVADAIKPKQGAPAALKKAMSPGAVFSVPFLGLFGVGFAVPLIIVMLFGFMPAKSFSLLHLPSLENYIRIFSGTYLTSFVWSLALAAATVGVLLVVCYPLAFAMVKIFRGFSTVITMAVVISLFVSENIRLYGWVLALMKRGIISGSLEWAGIGFEGCLYNAAVIVFGMVYVYLPFMLFPMILGISMIPESAREAAYDLGATWRQVFLRIDLPLAMPGIVTGAMLTFVLALGAMAEAKILGGDVVITFAEEIERAFTYGQNWPLGSALSTLLIVVAGAIIFATLRKIDLESLFGDRG